MGNYLRNFHIYIWLGPILISDWKYAGKLIHYPKEDTIFALFFSVITIVFFKLCWILLSQTYLQSTTLRLEEMRVKRRDAEQWMAHRLLPESLRQRIRRYEQYKWQETRGVDEDYLIRNLPKDLRRDIKQHLCLALLKRVTFPASSFLHCVFW